jgi:hypothetical protein
MRYVQRDASGALIGHYANPQPYAQEAVADDHPDVLAWQAAREAARGPTMAERLAALEERIAKLEARG